MTSQSPSTPEPRQGATEAGPAPALVLIADAAARDTPFLGLTLARRAVLAARKAGYGRTFLMASDAAGDAPGGPQRATAWREILAENPGRVVIVPAAAVAEVGWLEAAAEASVPAGGWAGVAGCATVIDGEAVTGVLDDLPTPADGASFDALERCLTDRLGPPAALSEAVDVMLVRAPGDIAVARRRLLAALVKETDGFMARHVERPISIAMSRWLAETEITPNQMTLISVGVGLIGAPFFLSAEPLWQTIGALLFLAHSILDGCDGELARLKFQESRWGGLLDFWGDNVVHIAIFACIAVGWAVAVQAAWPLALGAAAVIATAGSAGFIYWHLLREKAEEGPLFTSVAADKPQRLSRLLDGASRRDFIYLVVGLSLFGKASWFLVATAIGTPIYFVLLLVVAARERAV